MAGNMRRDPVGYRPFRVDPTMPDGLLPVSREGMGALERKVADAMFRVAGLAGEKADRQAALEGERAGRADALAGRPHIEVEGWPPQGGSSQPAGKAFKTADPVATDLPPQARAFLNAVAGGESGGRYNIRYTPGGGATFGDLTRHPGIMEPGPHGKSSAAGRYQFTQTTWNRLGGGDFSPENQDRRAWQLAQQDYKARTGRNLLSDLETEGVSNRMLSALTPTWQAFSSNRGRHIATYNDSLQRMVGRGELPPPQQNVTPQVDPSVQTPRIMVTGGGFRPTGRDTVYGRAYDAAGTRDYLQQLNSEIERTTEQAYELHKGDPAKLAEVFADLKDSQLRDHVFDEIRSDYELTYDRRAGRLVMAAQREKEKREAEENQAAFLTRTGELETEAARTLAGLDPSDPNASDTLAALRLQIDEHYDSAVARDVISPSAAADARARSNRSIAVGFYETQAKALAADDIPALREKMKADFAAGKLNGIDAQGWTSLESRLISLENATRQEEAKAEKSLAERGARIAARVEAGFDYDPAELGRLQLDAGNTPRGEEIVSGVMAMIDAAEIFRDRPIGEARAHVLEMRKRIVGKPKIQNDDGTHSTEETITIDIDQDGERVWVNIPTIVDGQRVSEEDAESLHLAGKNPAVGQYKTLAEAEKAARARSAGGGGGRIPSDAEISALAYAEKRLAELEDMVVKDPVAYEVATGRTELGTIDTSTPEGLAASLATRRDQMESISERYGSPFQFFRPHERVVLANALTENPDSFPDFVTALRESLGDKTTTALAELADDAPTLAHTAGLAIATKDNSISVEVARAISAKREGLFKAKMPAMEKFANVAGPMLAGALSGLDRTRAATVETAQLLFEADANRMGFDPAQIDKAGTPAAMAWRRALERSLGAQYVGGRQTGGLGAVNGGVLVVPTGMEPDTPQRLISRIDNEVMKKLPPIKSANGVEISSSQLRRARLVTVGDGIYRVALGDPDGWDPQYVMGADDDFWMLDLRQLETMAGERRLRSTFGWQVPDAIE